MTAEKHQKMIIKVTNPEMADNMIKKHIMENGEIEKNWGPDKIFK